MPYKDIRVRRKYHREWVRKRRQEWFADKRCADCGTSENLELDHINPATKVTHKIWTWSLERREKELAKCVARCKDCHKIKTAIDRGYKQHSKRKYAEGCRCQTCRAEHAKDMKRWRNLKK